MHRALFYHSVCVSSERSSCPLRSHFNVNLTTQTKSPREREGEASQQANKQANTNKKMETAAAVETATPRDVQLEREAGALRSFASLLSTSQHQNRAGAHHPQQQAPKEEEGPLSRLFQVLDEDPEACCCAVPCLQLSSIGSISSTITGSTSSRSSLEEASAESLAHLIRVETRNDLTNLPSRLLTNCLGSFRKLLEARCKQTIQALLGTSNQQPASCSDEAALVARLLAKLAIRTPESAQIHFRTLEFAERCSSPANVHEEHETTNWYVVDHLRQPLWSFRSSSNLSWNGPCGMILPE